MRIPDEETGTDRVTVSIYRCYTVLDSGCCPYYDRIRGRIPEQSLSLIGSIHFLYKMRANRDWSSYSKRVISVICSQTKELIRIGRYQCRSHQAIHGCTVYSPTQGQKTQNGFPSPYPEMTPGESGFRSKLYNSENNTRCSSVSSE